MNLATVYKSFRKQAAGEMPGQPAGGVYKPKPLPPPITAPGSVPIDQGMTPEPAAQQPQQGVDAKMLEKGWEKTMEAMQNMTAMNNGMPPQMDTPAQEQPQPVGSGIPGMDPKGMPIPGQMMNTASVNYGTIYQSMKKRASWLGRQINDVFGADTWMGRTFGESADTAARNFFNSQISPEMQAQRKADAAEEAKQLAEHQQRINRNIDRMVAEMQQGKKRPANTATAATAKQKSPARG